MLKYLLFISLSFHLYALDISLQGARENFQDFSIIHIKDKNKFLCQEIVNEFEVTTKIVCAFSTAPNTEIQKIQNNFFQVTTKIKKQTFFLILKPYKKMKLFPMVFNLSLDDSVYTPDVKLATHWMIVGYDKELPFIKKQNSSPLAINLPFLMSDDMLPSVGSLDIDGNPVHIQNTDDVSDFIKIKKYYKQKKYEKALDLIESAMQEHPNSLFNAELLYYKIISSDKLGYSDLVILLSKTFLREFSSDENVPQVLSVTAKAYSLSGMGVQADYFFDRLFNDHKESRYAKLGYIYKGEMLEDSGAASKALEWYKKALTTTKEVQTAVLAAYRLTNFYLESSKQKIATKYLNKIIKNDAKYLTKDYAKSFDMMELFADYQEYASAASIAEVLLDDKQSLDDSEAMQKNIGLWLSKTKQKDKALNALNRYLQTYPDGMFNEDVQTLKDSLFLEVIDSNRTQKLDNYNLLIDKYGDDSIGQRALYEKVKLLNTDKDYKEALKHSESILALDDKLFIDKKEVVNDSATGAVEIALQANECLSVLNVLQNYTVEVDDKWDEGIYQCAMKGADHKLAKKIASKHITSKDLNKRKKWLLNHIKIDFNTQNYTDVISASKELITLIEDDNKSPNDEVFRILFDTYQREQKHDEMIASILDIQKVFGVDFKDISRYMSLVMIGGQKDDDNIVIKYGEQVIKIQKETSSYTQSPSVEFTIYQSYIDKNRFNEAMMAMKHLDDIDLSKEKRARQKYLLGAIYEKLWRDADAKKAYQQSIDAHSTSPWAKLAKDAKDI